MPKKITPSIFILLVCPHEELLWGRLQISMFLELNNIKLPTNLEIKIDHSLPGSLCGCYYYKDDVNSIFINPENCYTTDNYRCGKDNSEYSYHGYVTDLTMYGVLIHEFCHYLCCQLIPNLVTEYKTTFPTNRLSISAYTNQSAPEEEIVELVRLYIQNPLFLKLISPPTFNFFKKRFKSPTTCSHKQAHALYIEFPEEIKHALKSQWKIVYNISTNKFERIDDANKISKAK